MILGCKDCIISERPFQTVRRSSGEACRLSAYRPRESWSRARAKRFFESSKHDSYADKCSTEASSSASIDHNTALALFVILCGKYLRPEFEPSYRL